MDEIDILTKTMGDLADKVEERWKLFDRLEELDTEIFRDKDYIEYLSQRIIK
jgi:chemotaxis methyl-accepting protein methylase